MAPRILYIEDSIDNLVLVRRVLNAAEFDLLEATSALEGIRMAKQHLPDLILMAPSRTISTRCKILTRRTSGI